MKAIQVNQANTNLTAHRRWKRKGLALFSLVICLSMLLAAPGKPALSAPAAPDAITAAFSYINNVSYNIPDGTSTTQTGCAYWPATRYFLVNDYFTINDLNVEFSQSHANRGQIRVKLTAPDGTTREIISTSGDTNNNYYITLDGDTGGSLNDGSDDTIGGTRRNVLQTLLNDFDGKTAHGHWTMTICDNTFNSTGTSQLFNEARLVFDGTAYIPTPYQHKQGPAVVETYFVPWPEDQVWTAMGRIYPSTCSTYPSFRDSYDAAPRQPMVGYISITIVDANTVVTYDQWEDGYDPSITFPSQTTTQVWGDGDLLNGVAPGDADDILAAGQVLTLNDVMLSTTLGTIFDFDARDKIAASNPIAVTRSVWSDGSQTLFAAADEIYPTDRWGTQFYSPVGDNANLNGMFDFSAVSIIAATDGTLVDIDKNGDGTYETTGISLSQGGTYFIDDTGTGMYRGGGIRSNSGHPIQVNQMTANTCSGYESRTYPLKPYDLWDASYYSPVGTVLDSSGAGSDDAPTTINLYNPNRSASINVCYDFATGGTNSVNIAANGGAAVTMNNLTGAHFYACTPGTTDNVADNFGSQSYSNNNGSVNWASSWSETGDDGSATSGSINIGGTGVRYLRFYTNAAANVGDTIERQSYNLTGYTTATLSFDYNDSSAESGDVLGVSVYDGSTWTQIATIAGNTSGSFSQDISGFISSNTRLRFSINARSGDTTTEYIYVDNVDITFSTSATPLSSVFYAVGSVDSDNAGGSGNDRNDTYDWGITLVPERVMSQALIVGWAPGDDPTFQGTGAENTAPIWLTGGHPIGSTQGSATYDICIDYNGDGGSTLDPVTGKYYNRQVTGIAPRAQVKIYKDKVVPPDTGYGTAGDDQTGTQIWVCGPTSPGPGDLATDVVITAAWGEDPLVAQPGKPGLDMGYTIRNQRTWRAAKGSALQVDLNGNGLYDEGDTIRYTILVANTSATTISSLTVTDDLPTNATYVLNSTYLTNDGTPPPASGQIPDSVTGTAFPLDGAGYEYTNLDSFKTFSITFDMTINPGASDPPGTVYNVAHVSDGTTTLNPDETIPVQRPRLGAIGNYVWLDEDGDGDQDVGEAGIPNVQVNLCSDADCNTILATTYTDANGGYLFPDLAIGAYYVRTYPPSGLNQTYDENGLATPNVTLVALGSGQEHLTADFGYNWAPAGDTNNNTNTGAIGDRVWVDMDGDGKQDAEEVGIQGVSVQLVNLGPDGLLGTVDDTTTLATTDANGNYLFDGLNAGAYVVNVLTPPAGYSQTGDPDHFAASIGVNDNTTTTPILLGPGDVFLNADFGYQPTTADVGSIGDTVWFDADTDGCGPQIGGVIQPNPSCTTPDNTEYGIPGVTVALIKDVNGDGAWDIDGLDNVLGTADDESVIATDITDANGQYLFSGLPASGTEDYLVWVNDTDNVLGDLAPTYDDNGIGTPNVSAVANLTTSGNTSQDFGYTPANHATGDGLIGDFVWLDKNGDGIQDAGEPGLEGVVVRLYNSSTGALLAVTVTDENGHYYFGDLPTSAGGVTYQVQVATASLPPGLTQTGDPDVVKDSTSIVTLTNAAPINLNQDFGYQGLNTISGTFWTDSDVDGYLDGEEAGRFDGVTVVLRDASGDIVATTTTSGGGNYSFTNLPDGTYYVDVTDSANVLNGYWKSNCPTGSCGQDSYSQVDPYPVTVGPTNRSDSTADFGYYLEPAAIGNFVWEDLDGDGQQDSGEPGIAGVEVTLTIAWPGDGTTTLKTITDASGYYSFGNLLQDEDYDGVGSPEPAFTVSVATPGGMAPTIPNVGSDITDSDLSGVTALPIKGTTDITYDFGFVRLPAAIGNKVWLDENGDGVQDPGEAGIPNVTVQLWNAAHTILIGTTVTDADGNYIFKYLPAGTYQVDVLNSTLPDPDGAGPGGLVQTTIPGGGSDFINHTDPYIVTVAAGGENMTADFGYNWAPSSDTDNNTNSGAIGDRVWIDSDGDGVQDAEETGLAGVTVELWYDSDANGTIDAPLATTLTDAAGSYIFDTLPAGIYEVRVTGGTTGYSQTGDPDYLGMACGSGCDARTTVPIVLGPGDVFLNADFGYQPGVDIGANIGDTVWLDANANGSLDGAEKGIPGVTVALIKDAGTIGLYEPGVDLVIATDITDANGNYLFTGLPVGGDYLVWVNDTDNVLGGLVPTYDDNGIITPNLSAVANLPVGGDLDQDFGYAPLGQSTGEGLIGDTIFYDRNGNLTPDAGEGIEGVKVQLFADTNGDGNYDAGEPLLMTTVTDENGNYAFGNLPAGNYVVVVDTTTLPGGLANTVDPDITNSPLNESGVALAAGEINLAQDFGYRSEFILGSIGDLVWNDVDADGYKDPLETGIDGVTVDLYWDANDNGVLDAADKLIGSTTTSGGGGYSFPNLLVDDGDGDMDYFVHVSDRDNVLNGYWHSLGATGTNDNSQADPYLVTLTPAVPTDLTADFGYYIQPAAVGNWVWYDANSDGIQDVGEVGVPDWPVTLTITWPDASVTVLQTTTDANGYYSFGNLLQDEDYPASGGPGQPSMVITLSVPDGYLVSPQNQTTEDLDSDNPAGESAIAAKGYPPVNPNNTYDFGFEASPTSITVSDPSANAAGQAIVVDWTTWSEIDVLGFNLYRAASSSGSRTLVFQVPARHPGKLLGDAYQYTDADVQPGIVYTYWLEVLRKDGSTVIMQPTTASLAPAQTRKVFLPAIMR